MSTSTISLKLKVLGFGAAAVIGAAMLLGATNSATAATYTCNSATAAGGPGDGTCYNNGTQGNPTGDFTLNGDWQSDFGWTLVVGEAFDKSQFGSPANKAVGGQSAANVETVMESADWFNQELYYVGQVDDLGGETGETSTKLQGNVYYYHAGNNAMAWYFDELQEGFSVYSGDSANGWSNLRVFSTNMSVVPIPAALPLFGAALLGLVVLSRRRKNKALQA